jgi:hypothetical protein
MERKYLILKPSSKLLLAHKLKYPLIQPSDLTKLVYQSYFGPAHLIDNPESSMAYLVEECEYIKANQLLSYNQDLIEDIGKNYVRVNLIPFLNEGLALEDLNKALVLSASVPTKAHNLESRKLLENIPSQGYHHSDIYRSTYHPHYRVIHKDYLSIIRRKI